MKKSFGNVVNADMCMKAKQRRKLVLHVCIRKRISNQRKAGINQIRYEEELPVAIPLFYLTPEGSMNYPAKFVSCKKIYTN